MSSPDVMRQTFAPITEQQRWDAERIKGLMNDLHAELVKLGDSREMSLAKTKLEEASMWAVKHITRG